MDNNIYFDKNKKNRGADGKPAPAPGQGRQDVPISRPSGNDGSAQPTDGSAGLFSYYMSGSSGSREPSDPGRAQPQAEVPRSRSTGSPSPYAAQPVPNGRAPSTSPTAPSAAPGQRRSSASYRSGDEYRAAVGRGAIKEEYDDASPSAGRPAPARPRKRHRHIFARIVAFLLVIVLLCGAGGVLAAMSLAKKVNFYASDQNSCLSGSGYSLTSAASSASVRNILLIGQDDHASGEYGRSDSMILVSINSADRTIKLTSFLRDMWVEIPGHGYAKMNAACSYGGPSLVMATIAYNFNVRVDNYMTVGFSAFAQIIDSLGGITIDSISQTEADELAGGSIYVNAGTNVHLDGAGAIMYCRIRHLETDFERTARQRKVIGLVIDKAKHTSPIKLYKIAATALSLMDTDLTQKDIVSLCAHSLAYIRYDMTSEHIPADNTWEYGTRKSQSVIIIDTAANAQTVKTFIYGG